METTNFILGVYYCKCFCEGNEGASVAKGARRIYWYLQLPRLVGGISQIW
jgi:hypothetical protein